MPGTAGVECFAHRAEHRLEPGRLRRGYTQSPDHLLFVEPEQLAGGGRATEYTRGAGDVKAALVVRRIDCHADAALGFDAQDECVHEILTARVQPLPEREDRRCNRARRVNDGFEVRVVVVEHVRGDAVEERRVHDVEALCSAEHGGFGLAGELGEGRKGAIGRDVASTA